MNRPLLIAIGNPLRGDDGVAHRVLELLNLDSRSLFQLTPELAKEISGREVVVFIDADASMTDLRVEDIVTCSTVSAFSHIARPEQIVALSRALYGFRGRALLCRIPAADFSLSELSKSANLLAARAAEQLRLMLDLTEAQSASPEA